jgi:superfamily I DNA/RNA helicase
MTTVAVSKDFFTAFSRLPQAQQKKTREFMDRFQANPKSAAIHYEPIKDMRDKRVRTVRIDLAYRAIVLHPEQGDTFLMLWVDHHDEAMDWARRKVFEVNETTGAFQVYDAVEVGSLPIPPVTQPKAVDAYGPFEAFADEDLLRVGLPGVLLPAVRALPSADQLEELKPHLPEEAYEALFWIGHLGYSVDQALGERESRPAVAVDAQDVEAALAHPDSRRRFAVVRSADELEQMLDAPLAQWRVFLHPSQARLVRRHFAGPARVLGGAGTGKTVVAMHRIRHLAQNVFNASTDRLLFTTFTRNLADNIRANLRGLCGDEFDRLEVVHLHGWAMSYLRGQGVNVEIATNADVRAAWREALAAHPGPWPEAFYRSEWERVAQAQGLRTREEYLQALRAGQSQRLTRPQRDQVWLVLDAYRQRLAARGKREWLDVIREARERLAAAGEHPYRAVVVDETQDLHAEELRLIRQLAPEGPNDLFFVGDAHQRIYGRPLVLAQCGINVRGRASKLRLNYRTTDEIRGWSVGLLAGQAVDDLDAGADTAQDYRSLLHGLAPEVRHFATADDELAFIIERLKELTAEVPAETMCLVARTSRLLTDHYLPALRAAGLPVCLLTADTPDAGTPGVRLATLHRVKGLEFAHVLIASVNDGVIPLEAAHLDPDSVEQAEGELRERCLLHVAATRARDTLAITSHGKSSRLLSVHGSSAT